MLSPQPQAVAEPSYVLWGVYLEIDDTVYSETREDNIIILTM